MSKTLLVAAILGIAFSASAQAVYMPPADQPLYLKFDNQEQLSPTNGISSPSGASESNWGVFLVSTINLGGVIPADQLFNSAGVPIFTNSLTGQITGMFWGATGLAPNASCPTCFDSTGGHIDLWWDNPSAGGTFADISTAVPGDRTGDNTFTNFTDGTFLARLDFASGIDSTDSSVFIRGNTVPSTAGFTGLADSYANVDTSVVGAWTDLLNGDFFNTAFGQRDIRLKNSYNYNADWNTVGADQQPVIGATSQDPVRGFTVPEPGSLALFGLSLSLLGMGLIRRRQRQ